MFCLKRKTKCPHCWDIVPRKEMCRETRICAECCDCEKHRVFVMKRPKCENALIEYTSLKTAVKFGYTIII